MIIINFKNYKFGKKSLELARKIEKYLGKRAIVAVSGVDIGLIAGKTKLKVYAQHVDNEEGKRASGFILPEAVKKEGAVGTLLNHSEHRISFKEIKESLKKCRKIGLKAVVCASSLSEVRKIKKLKPYAIAFEDSKLVGSGKSITKYRSNDVKKFAFMLKRGSVLALCGAGINSADDVREAFRLGCRGVLIASAIANVNKPERLLKEIAGVGR